MPSSDFQKLHKRFTKKHRQKTKSLWQKYQNATTRFAAAGALSAILTLNPLSLPSPQAPKELQSGRENQQILATTLAQPKVVVYSTQKSEFQLSQFINLQPKEVNAEILNQAAGFLSQKFGLTATTTIDNINLPIYFGWIGAEQHLQRFPGDSVSLHDEFQSSGIAPHVGAWGYFASTPSKLTNDLKLKEEYYVAIQTFNLPQWNKDWAKLKEWFKYRKIIVVNPQNQRAVVAVVADAGPADWTGKQMGGSPEVMDRLGLTFGFRKGQVLMFYVDDPKDQIPLGEIKVEEK